MQEEIQFKDIPVNIKLAFGGTFLVGVIFWAGATYNRMGNIEAALGDIRVSLSSLNDVPVLRIRVSQMEDRVGRMEEKREKK